MQEINISEKDEIKFIFKEGKTYLLSEISTKDFKNKIWTNGFLYGLMAGSGMVLLIVVVFPSSI